MSFLKTPVVAQTLGVTYGRLFQLIREGKLSPPAKDSSGDYVWLEADVDRARAVLRNAKHRPNKQLVTVA